jgi:hypothetical protein
VLLWTQVRRPESAQNAPLAPEVEADAQAI